MAGKPRILLDFPTERRPFKHQIEAMAAAQALDYRVLLADDMGLGKTATALWSLHHAGASYAVVVCPASVKFNWAREVMDTIGYKPLVIHGTPKKRADQFVELRALLGERELVSIINYDLLIRLSDEHLALLQECATEAVIIDEAHYVKERTSERTQTTWKLAMSQRNKVRMLLTGTPVRNTVTDLYMLANFVCPKTWTSFAEFERRHCVYVPMQVGSGHRKRTTMQFRQAKEEDRLSAVVNTFQIRRRKEEVLDLPPKLRTFPELQLDDVTKKVYRAMKEWGVKELSELDPTASVFSPQAKNALEILLRLEQLAQGFMGGIPDPVMARISPAVRKRGAAIPGRSNEVIFPSASKLMWLQETLRTLVLTGHRPTVFMRFKAPMFWLVENLEWETLALHGEVGDRDGIIETFQRGEAQVFLCQVSMAEGFNLTQSQDAIFYGRDWSPAVNAQAEDRLHRIGQKGTVNIQVPIVTDTVERLIHAKLQVKADAAQHVLASLTVADLRKVLGRGPTTVQS